MLDLYLRGGNFMHPLLICSIIGIGVIIERIISLWMAGMNNKKFMTNAKLHEVLMSHGIEEALLVCQKSRSPVASILEAGLRKYASGMSEVEKAIEFAAGIEMSFLEKRLSWLCIIGNVDPMIGFLGTASGMIRSFDAIALAGRIEPSLVASGISEALITTAGGLVVALPMQIAYSFFVAKIDSLVLDMEESSYNFLDALIELEEGV